MAAPLVSINPKKTFVQSRHEKLDNRTVLEQEHRVELWDLLQECTIALKAIYRSKFMFGEYLKYVDPNFESDGVNEFNLATPPPFDSSFIASKVGDEVKSQQGEVETLKDKLRTAEELIRKLYKRNSHLEVELKYFKDEVQRRKAKEVSGGPRKLADDEVGQIPKHPLMNKRLIRRTLSSPPTRILLQTAVLGSKPQKASKDDADAKQLEVEEDPAVANLKGKVLSLTEALVTCQHDNTRLMKEKKERVSLRDTLIRKYLIERDTNIAQLYTTLQEISDKISNPLRLSKVRQPDMKMSPVVAGNNIVREISQKLTDQIASATSTLLKTGDTNSEELLKTCAQITGDGSVAPSNEGRKKELVRRVRAIAEALPVPKKKALLGVLTELKHVNRCLVDANKATMQTYEDLKTRLNNDMVQLKLEAAILRDQVRSLGGTVKEDTTPA